MLTNASTGVEILSFLLYEVFHNPNITSAAANQLASVANKQSSNPFAVSYLTLVYIEYEVIFGIPAAVGTLVFVAYKYRKQYKYRKFE